MMQKPLMLIIPIAALLVGCAAPQPPYYTKLGVPQQQIDRDAYECERDARMVRGDACTQIHMYEACMRSKGYSPQSGTGNIGMCRQVF
jgi:hypothetical protein